MHSPSPADEPVSRSVRRRFAPKNNDSPARARTRTSQARECRLRAAAPRRENTPRPAFRLIVTSEPVSRRAVRARSGSGPPGGVAPSRSAASSIAASADHRTFGEAPPSRVRCSSREYDAVDAEYRCADDQRQFLADEDPIGRRYVQSAGHRRAASRKRQDRDRRVSASARHPAGARPRTAARLHRGRRHAPESRIKPAPAGSSASA